jgi:predicted DCC family thiol-disulfide oxidoreductase YuxK
MTENTSRAEGKQPLLVFFDEHCRFCRRVAGLLATLGSPNHVRFLPARNLDAYTRDETLLSTRYLDMVSLGGSDSYRGYETYVQIAARIRVLRVASWFLGRGWVRRFGERVYQHVARSRSCVVRPPGRPHDDCS